MVTTGAGTAASVGPMTFEVHEVTREDHRAWLLANFRGFVNPYPLSAEEAEQAYDEAPEGQRRLGVRDALSVAPSGRGRVREKLPYARLVPRVALVLGAPLLDAALGERSAACRRSPRLDILVGVDPRQIGADGPG